MRRWWIMLNSGEAEVDCFGNVIYFDSLEEAEEYLVELDGLGEVVRQS